MVSKDGLQKMQGGKVQMEILERRSTSIPIKIQCGTQGKIFNKFTNLECRTQKPIAVFWRGKP